MCLKEPVVHILKNVEEMLMTKATTFYVFSIES